MTNTTEIEAIIKSKGLKKKAIAQQLRLSSYGLALKLNNKNEFKANEITKLCDILGVKSLREKERLFFATEVEGNSTK